MPNIFNVNPLGGPLNPLDANDPAVSFDEQIGLSRSGLRDAVANHGGVVFTTLNFFYRRYMDMSSDERAEQAISLATALAAGTRPAWEALATLPDNLKNVLDVEQLTEAMRCVSGFLTMVEGMLKPLVEPFEHEREAQAAADAAEIVIDRVVAHLHCLREYYVQRFLRYLVEQTAGVALPAFVRDVISRMQISLQARQLLLSVFDPRDAFLDRNEVVVPPRGPADVGQLVTALGGRVEVEPVEVETIAEEVDVPFDGVHLEIAPGDCRLPDVPDRAEVEIGELSLKNLRADAELPPA